MPTIPPPLGNASVSPPPSLPATPSEDNSSRSRSPIHGVHDHFKSAPVCLEMSLFKESMTTRDLSEMVFAESSATAITTSAAAAMEEKEEEEVAVTMTRIHHPTVVQIHHLPNPPPPPHHHQHQHHSLPLIVSSSSSTCTRETNSDIGSDVECPLTLTNTISGRIPPISPSVHSVAARNPLLDDETTTTTTIIPVITTTAEAASVDTALTSSAAPATTAASAAAYESRRVLQENWNAKVSLMKTSRQGRTSQRWMVIDPPPTHPTTTTDGSGASIVANINPPDGSGCGGDGSDGTACGVVRLVTGCVPILNNGSILLISSSRQSEWILPKGGWEQDESMAESAVRECFEEAGVLGVLGPPLQDIQYETRKSKKRRRLLLQECNSSSSCTPLIVQDDDAKGNNVCCPSSRHGSPLLLVPLPPPLPESTDAAVGDDNEAAIIAEIGDQPILDPHPSLSSPAIEERVDSSSSVIVPSGNNALLNSTTTTTPMNLALTSSSPISREDLTRIRWLAQRNAPKASDETASVASNVSSSTVATTTMPPATTHSQVRMVLFPLYVTKIHEDWPERGRLRTAVHIDQALTIMENRPEFKMALQEVKSRGLYRSTCAKGRA